MSRKLSFQRLQLASSSLPISYLQTSKQKARLITLSATEHVTAKIYLVLAITIIDFWNGMNSSHILAACVQINPSTFNITGSAL
jgi:hypothetical protein